MGTFVWDWEVSGGEREADQEAFLASAGTVTSCNGMFLLCQMDKIPRMKNYVLQAEASLKISTQETSAWC